MTLSVSLPHPYGGAIRLKKLCEYAEVVGREWFTSRQAFEWWLTQWTFNANDNVRKTAAELRRLVDFNILEHDYAMNVSEIEGDKIAAWRFTESFLKEQGLIA